MVRSQFVSLASGDGSIDIESMSRAILAENDRTRGWRYPSHLSQVEVRRRHPGGDSPVSVGTRYVSRSSLGL